MAFDDKYVFPALVALYSGRKSYSGEIRLVVGFDLETLSNSSISLVQGVCERLEISVQFLPLDIPHFLTEVGHISKMSWSRMFLMEKLREDFVWIDCDVILQPGWAQVLNGDFDSDSGIVGALDTGVAHISTENSALSRAGANYINAGVLVVDPMRLSAELHAEFSDAMRRYGELGFEWMDQDVINYCFSGNTGVLHRSLNTQVPLPRLGTTRGIILHFSSDAKPWLGVYRLAFFWSFSVRRWNQVAGSLLRELKTDRSLAGALHSLRNDSASSRHLLGGKSTWAKKILVRFASIIWRSSA